MVNPYRGEVGLILNGEARNMRLTLGALAELEASLEAESLVDLIDRFESGAFRAGDLVALILASLHGAGNGISREEFLAAEIEGGPVEAARKAAELLRVTFSLPEVE